MLFSVYIDGLLARLSNAGVGCRIGHTFLGALCYADDLQLMAPTKHALKSMLIICAQFASEHMLIFNATKSRLLVFGEKVSDSVNFFLNGKAIPRLEAEKHLGNWFGPGLIHEHLEAAVNDMYSRTNQMLAMFGKCHFSVKYKLFKSFCTAAYGSSLWDLSDSSAEYVYVAWRKCVRRLLGVPPTTHCALLPLICQNVTFDVQLHKRFLGFFEKPIHSNNSCVSLCAKLALNGSRSHMCCSLNFVCRKYGVNKRRIESDGRQAFVSRFTQFSVDENEDNMSKAGAIRDLLDMRDSRVSVLTENELEFILNESCCN